MTATEAYNCDTVFRLLVEEWVRERRCPYPLVDRCLDFDMESQADCARWAASEPDRGGSYKHKELVGPYPCEYQQQYYWLSSNIFYAECKRDDEEVYHTAYIVPRNNLPNECGYHTNRFTTVLFAILWLLDNWINLPQDKT